MPKPERILTHHDVTAACALDTVPLLAARVRNLLSWGRRISVASRWLGARDGDLDLHAGLVVAEDMGGRVIRGLVRPGEYATFSVQLTGGVIVAFDAYAADEGATEMQVWRRYHDGERRRITLVRVVGGLDDRVSPGACDQITITSWGPNGAGRQTTVGFDSHAYDEAWAEREQRGLKLSGHDTGIEYCEDLAQVGRYRVRCAMPIYLGSCAGLGDHVTAASAEVVR